LSGFVPQPDQRQTVVFAGGGEGLRNSVSSVDNFVCAPGLGRGLFFSVA
jgi:hypothetical protein